MANETVVVGCKLPNGYIIHLAADLKNASPDSTRVKLNGPQTRGAIIAATGGYGLTRVPAEYWAAWMKENKNHLYVKNGIIFHDASEANALAIAKTQAGIKSGLEAIDPMKPGKGLQPMNYEGIPSDLRRAAEQEAA